MHFPDNNLAFKPRALYFLLSVCFESEAAMSDSRMNHYFESILFDESLKRASLFSLNRSNGSVADESFAFLKSVNLLDNEVAKLQKGSDRLSTSNRNQSDER